MSVRDLVTTILDLLAIGLVVAGGFLIDVGLGVLTSGLGVGLVSMIITRSARRTDLRPQ